MANMEPKPWPPALSSPAPSRTAPSGSTPMKAPANRCPNCRSPFACPRDSHWIGFSRTDQKWQPAGWTAPTRTTGACECNRSSKCSQQALIADRDRLTEVVREPVVAPAVKLGGLGFHRAIGRGGDQPAGSSRVRDRGRIPGRVAFARLITECRGGSGRPRVERARASGAGGVGPVDAGESGVCGVAQDGHDGGGAVALNPAGVLSRRDRSRAGHGAAVRSRGKGNPEG